MSDEIKEKCIDCEYSRQCVTMKQINSECCLKDRENEKKDEIKEDEFIKNNRKFFNYLINLENRDLRKEIENCNWNTILQLIRYCGYEITNLQEENERLKETNIYCNRTDCSGRIKDSRKYDSVYQEREDYKSRCEKATKYIKNHTIEWVDERFEVHNIMVDVDEYFNPEHAIWLLNGGDE